MLGENTQLKKKKLKKKFNRFTNSNGTWVIKATEN